MTSTLSELAPRRAGLLTVSVFGLGYLGCVSAAYPAARGHHVVCVDANRDKMELLRLGQSPVVEERIGELTAEVAGAGRLTVAADPAEAVLGSDVSIVCFGTPSATRYLECVSAQIGEALASKDVWYVVVLGSPMVPGTCQHIAILERTSGIDFGVCVNPDFLRGGTTVCDFENPPKTVIGESDERSGAVVMSLHDGPTGPRFRVPITEAEMTEYVDNSFRALKVTFGDEFGALCAPLRPDSDEVMDIFLTDMQVRRVVELAERLIGEGYDVRIYFTAVALSKSLGANRSNLEERLPHISQWVTDDVESLLEHDAIFIAGSKDPVVVAAIDRLSENRIVIDLVRLPGAEERRLKPGYVGIGW